MSQAGPFVSQICKSMFKQLFLSFVLWLSDFWQYKMAAAAFKLKEISSLKLIRSILHFKTRIRESIMTEVQSNCCGYNKE